MASLAVAHLAEETAVNEQRRRQLASLNARTRWVRARIPVDQYDMLEAAAAERDLPMSRLVRAAISDLLDRLIPVEELILTRSRDEDDT